MMRRFPSTPDEFRAVLRRRIGWILWPALGIMAATVAIGLLLPREYKSEALIIVQPQKIPADLVKASVNGDMADRLQALEQQVLSRTQLSQIISDLGLYPKLREDGSMDDAVAELRKNITLEPVLGANADRHNVDALKISYLGPTPQLAHDVTDRIANLFVQGNMTARTELASGTKQFLAQQLDESRQQLQQAEQKLKSYASTHSGAMPEQEQTNLQMIGQYQSLEQANSEAMDRATQQRSYMQSMLGVTNAKASSPTAVELLKKKQELAAARAKYTDAHPEVARLQDDVTQLQSQLNSEPAGVTGEPTQADQYRGQINSLNQEIKQRTERQAEIEGKIRGLQGRVSAGPGIESDVLDLNREYQDALKNYQSLLDKYNASGVAAALEDDRQAEQFRIQDPASTPRLPDSPNLKLILAGGLLGALAIGFGLGILMELRDGSLHSGEDVETYLKVPIISVIPSIPLDAPVVRRGSTLTLPGAPT